MRLPLICAGLFRRWSRHAPIRDLLAQGMTPYQQKLNSHLIKATYAKFCEYARLVRENRRKAELNIPKRVRKRWREEQVRDRRRAENSPLRLLIDFLRVEIRVQLERLERLNAGNLEFRKTWARVANDSDPRRLLMDYAAELGASWRQRWGDRRALDRWMSDDALNDRYLRRRGETELNLMFLLDRLGFVAREIASLVETPGDVIDLWQRLGLESLLLDLLGLSCDRRVPVAALRCLKEALTSLPESILGEIVGDALQTVVQRTAMDGTAETWLQCEAISCLERLSPSLAARVIVQRMTHPLSGDDLFVRRHCLRLSVGARHRLWGDGPPSDEEQSVWQAAAADPQDSVRQQWAQSLWQLPPGIAAERLMLVVRNDRCGAVRAAALCAPLQQSIHRDLTAAFLTALAQTIADEADVFTRRTALHVAEHWLARQYAGARQPDDPPALEWQEIEQLYQRQIVPALRAARHHAPEVAVRRWAAAALEQIWVRLDPQASRLYDELRSRIRQLRPGKSRRLPAKLVNGYSRDLIGRVMAVLTQRDFGLELIDEGPGIRLRRPPVFGFRWWRTWFEFCRPATDKRQAHRHTVGRVPRGVVRAPSRILGELSQTKVPGEPLVIASDTTWRPFLPLPDDLVSSVNQCLLSPHPIRLYSSEGVTEIEVCGGPLSRLHTAFRITTQFPQLAELRNWTPDASMAPSDYLAMAKELGFNVRFREHDGGRGIESGNEADETVTQFFPAIGLVGGSTSLPFLKNLLSDYAYYFGSAFENTLAQLVTFTAAMLVFFLSKHAYSNWRIWLARRRIGLIVGGWGTRGKSGTERLKAALFNALSHPLVSKTTGCEAMFIQSHAGGDPLEIPLYRPADKATIWEQSNLLRFAARLDPSVFLWECMALTPDYVDVLQRQWTHDDLSTITNTYPDHEDVQGPSGYDVATTIAGFVPRRSHLITTEQQMRPLLEESCDRMKTSLRGVTWLESGLITNDLLDRFPYREHPDNIALVAAMADELGCDFDFSVKAMADRLIPDLGVLKTHPTARVQHCQIEFSNGMSANERFGAMGNWVRLGYDRQDAFATPSVWVSSVINNRADRVARSRVFAHVMVNDIQVDRYFLIGGNLKGLQGFVSEAWAEYAHALSLRREGTAWDLERTLQTLEKLAARFRVPHHESHLVGALVPMLEHLLPVDQRESAAALAETLALDVDQGVARLQSLDCDAATVTLYANYHHDQLRGFREYQALVEAARRIQQDGQVAPFEQQVRDQLRTWFERKVVVIENYDATGDEVIQRIVDETPPGYLNRVMGMQNIKGTGLDFVYRFHAWDACEQACRLLKSRDQEVRKTGLSTLDGLPDFGLLCHTHLRESLEELRRATPPMLPDMQVQVESIEKKLLDALSRVKQDASPKEEVQMAPWLVNLIHRCEQWMEIPDATRRRNKADQIYRDLADERIGRLRAVEELRKLNKRQKGGWLMSALAKSRH